MPPTYPSSVYNVVDYGPKRWKAGNSTGSVPADNLACIQGAVTTAQSNGGGVIILPDIGTDLSFGVFYVSGTVTIDASTNGAAVLLMGTGSTILSKTDASNMFDITNTTTDPNNMFGMGFQDLAVLYDTSLKSGTAFTSTSPTTAGSSESTLTMPLML